MSLFSGLRTPVSGRVRVHTAAAVHTAGAILTLSALVVEAPGSLKQVVPPLFVDAGDTGKENQRFGNLSLAVTAAITVDGDARVLL